MNEKTAGDLATEIARILADENGKAGKDSERTFALAHKALATYLEGALPDPDAAAIVEVTGEAAPVIAVLAARRLYLIEALPINPDEIVQATTRCRMVDLDLEPATVEVDVRYAGTMLGEGQRFSKWRFKLGNATLQIETAITEGETLSRREDLARKLAGALGWKLPATEAVVELEVA